MSNNANEILMNKLVTLVGFTRQEAKEKINESPFNSDEKWTMNAVFGIPYVKHHFKVNEDKARKIKHAFPIAPYVSSVPIEEWMIDLSDFMEVNIDEIRSRTLPPYGFKTYRDWERGIRMRSVKDIVYALEFSKPAACKCKEYFCPAHDDDLYSIFKKWWNNIVSYVSDSKNGDQKKQM